MKLLREVLSGVTRLRDQAPEQETVQGDEIDRGDGEQMADELSNVDDQAGDVDPEVDNAVDTATEDPNRQGLIRTVKKAHLVYKRTGDDGTFTELWLYNIENMQQQTKVKRAILAGTDIPPNQLTSPDGGQSYKVWAVGNAEMLEITGLPS